MVVHQSFVTTGAFAAGNSRDIDFSLCISKTPVFSRRGSSYVHIQIRFIVEDYKLKILHMSRFRTNPLFIVSDTNRTVHPQKMVRDLQ